MRAVPAGLQANMDEDTTTLCRIVRITSKDGDIVRATDASDNVTDGIVTYQADPGFLLTSVTHNSEGSASAADIQVHVDNSILPVGELAKGVWDGATVEVAVVDWDDMSAGEMGLLYGYIGSIQWDTMGGATIEVQGFLEKVRNKSLERIGSRCPVDLFSTHCRVVEADYTFEGTVTTVTNQMTVETNLNDPDFDEGYFRFGVLTWLTGANAGRKAPVRTWTPAGNVVHFWTRPPDTIVVGDTFSITAGCDKSMETCHARFSNSINFQGFPFDITEAESGGYKFTSTTGQYLLTGSF